MGKIANILKYQTIDLLPQVDPDVMRPIFEKNLNKMSFYAPEDYLRLWKTNKDDMLFRYRSDKISFTWFNGTVYAQKPRKHFEDIDTISFMQIDMLSPDTNGEIFNTIEAIAIQAGIEKVVREGLGVTSEDAEILRNMKGGHRDIKYGLGLYTR